MSSNSPGAYAEFSEVMITRRLFRDGESEYTINKIPCRLLDVREFFMGTGVGARTYSLVEQNSVASLVEAKPEERRQFIEEAAGISKYKSRKESAVRKMEATQQNLLRLNDIIREVKSQLGRDLPAGEEGGTVQGPEEGGEGGRADRRPPDLCRPVGPPELPGRSKKCASRTGDGDPDAPAGPRSRPGGS